MEKEMENQLPKRDKKLLWTLFLAMFKLGAFTFGGGYAIVPMMQKEYVEKRHWINENEMIDIVAISQSVPGAIAVNASIFIGYRLAGVPGALLSTLGASLPSLIILAIISLFYQAFIANTYVAAAMQGIRACVVAMMISAVIKLGKPALVDWLCWVLALATCVAVLWLDINAIYLILAGGVIGFIAGTVRARRGKKAEGEAKK